MRQIYVNIFVSNFWMLPSALMKIKTKLQPAGDFGFRKVDF